ncbi:MAG TPA: tRNA (adenosine(37)-N6)-dimethylallyltransferase MiaA [Thermoanaerobaculia bacterium]
MRIVASAPLLVVLGPTGSGKSELAHQLARLRGGEIVSADAFAVYRGMDIGTAKPSAEQRREVVYHLIDVARPSDFFSAGRWAREAREAVDDIHRRGRLPIVCGGSGFYLEALLEGLPPGGAVDAGLRSALTEWAKDHPEAAHRFLEVNDPISAGRIPPANLRYTLRALEILLDTGTRASDRARTGAGWTARWRLIKIGLRPSADQLYATIARRVRQMLNAGWDLEVRRLLEAGAARESNAFQAIGYREVADWVAGLADRSETEGKIVTATRQLAKKQRTWFARERDVLWVTPDRALGAALDRLDEGDTEKSG